MIVKYEPVEYGKGYDIVHNPDQFKLTIDGKTYDLTALNFIKEFSSLLSKAFVNCSPILSPCPIE